MGKLKSQMTLVHKWAN